MANFIGFPNATLIVVIIEYTAYSRPLRDRRRPAAIENIDGGISPHQ
jgi:hypothetical protein